VGLRAAAGQTGACLAARLAARLAERARAAHFCLQSRYRELPLYERSAEGPSQELRVMHTSRYFLITVVGGALVAGSAFAQPRGEAAGPPSIPPWQEASPWPDRIVVTVAEDPATSFSVSWRTSADVESARAEIVLAGDHTRFDIGATSVDARTEKPDLNRKIIDGEEYPLRWNDSLTQPAYHSVTFEDLAPDTLYAYRVMGADGHWSEWFQTRTAPEAGTPFR